MAATYRSRNRFEMRINSSPETGRLYIFTMGLVVHEGRGGVLKAGDNEHTVAWGQLRDGFRESDGYRTLSSPAGLGRRLKGLNYLVAK